MGLREWLNSALSSTPGKIERALEEVKSNTFLLSLEVAESSALEWLAGLPKEDVWDEPIDPETLRMLPLSAQGILRRFPRFEVGGASLGGEQVSLIGAPDDMCWIGSDLEHARVAVSLTDGRLWIVEPDQVLVEGPATAYPSLAHYLLVLKVTMEPEWWVPYLGRNG
jgi:hypothetical protein